MESSPKVIKIPGQRRVKLAKWLLRHHPLKRHEELPPSKAKLGQPIRIVCISDTHNLRPDLPTGDILIHAGDLTVNGSFQELQEQLDWLSSQPHRHKILIAGNHDVLLDEKFLEKHPERKYGDSRTAKDLNWGSVNYLQDTSVTLKIPASSTQETKVRQINIFGSPWTPRYGISAFQYPREEEVWSSLVPTNTNILITHGPPRLYLDQTNIHNAGCVYLTRHVARVKPRLMVFGHIHAAHGRQDVVLTRSRALHDDIVNRWGSYGTLARLVVAIALAKAHHLGARFGTPKQLKPTTFVNASMIDPQGRLRSNVIVVDI